MEPERLERKKICASCRIEFSCYTHNCWCAELPNLIPLTAGNDCLCPGCLKKAIARKIEDEKLKMKD